MPFLKKYLSPIDFDLTASDLRRMKDGVAQICRVYLNAGAERVIPSTFDPLEIVNLDQVMQFEDAVAESDDISFGSSHPQGGNPMSDDRAVGAVDSRMGPFQKADERGIGEEVLQAIVGAVIAQACTGMEIADYEYRAAFGVQFHQRRAVGVLRIVLPSGQDVGDCGGVQRPASITETAIIPRQAVKGGIGSNH